MKMITPVETVYEVNLNTRIKVKLTEYGKEWHKKDYEKLCGSLKYYLEPEVDPHGYSEFTLWDFMNIFGKSFFNGCPPDAQVIEPNCIYLIDSDK